jgi:hypothetical protein
MKVIFMNIFTICETQPTKIASQNCLGTQFNINTKKQFNFIGESEKVSMTAKRAGSRIVEMETNVK